MRALIIISVDATPKALDRLSEMVDGLVMDFTMEGGVNLLESDEARGKDVKQLIKRLIETTEPVEKKAKKRDD